MKSINKKLYTIIAVCLLTMIFSVVALAETGTSSGSDTSLPSVTTSQTGTTESEGNTSTESGDESNTQSGDESGDGTQSGEEATSSDLTGSDSSLTSGESDLSSVESTTSETSSKPKYHGNIGGTVSDGIDTSGWGTGANSESPASVGTTKKTGGKKITDFNVIFNLMIIVGVILMVAAISALIYVNRKSFLKTASATAGRNNLTERQKRKNNHKNRTNVYRPRD